MLVKNTNCGGDFGFCDLGVNLCGVWERWAGCVVDGVGFVWNLILSQSDVTDSLIDRRPVRERQRKVWSSKTFQYLTGVQRPCKNEPFYSDRKQCGSCGALCSILSVVLCSLYSLNSVFCFPFSPRYVLFMFCFLCILWILNILCSIFSVFRVLFLLCFCVSCFLFFLVRSFTRSPCFREFVCKSSLNGAEWDLLRKSVQFLQCMMVVSSYWPWTIVHYFLCWTVG